MMPHDYIQVIFVLPGVLQDHVTIEPVGSCSSLVLRTILAEEPAFSSADCLRMIRKTILTDTVCLR